MILIDFFDEASCKGTELIEGWYFYDDADDSVVGGPFSNEEAAIKAAFDGHGWWCIVDPAGILKDPAEVVFATRPTLYHCLFLLLFNCLFLLLINRIFSLIVIKN